MEYTTATNCRANKTRWAFTLVGDDVEACETTTEGGIAVTLLGHPCRVIIGPVEMADETVSFPHRHCMIIRPGSGMTRGAARRSVEEFLPTVSTEEYFNAVMNHHRYLQYMFKSTNVMNTFAEKELKKVLDDMTEKGLGITPRSFQHHVTVRCGPHFYQKNKELCKTMLAQPDIFGPKVVVPFEVNDAENYANAVKVICIFNKVLKRAVEQNGYSCTAKGFENMDPTDIANTITLIACLPFLRQRWEGVDQLPGIYLYGKPGTGKSHLFQNAPYYKKVASDAQGVSRYRLDGCQRAYLLDDVNITFFEDRMNMTTLRQLTLGGSATVKVLGDVQEVRGWIAATSNDIPVWLSDDVPSDQVDNPNWARNCSAWRRRFIFVELTEQLDITPINVQWNHGTATDAARDMMIGLYEQMPESAQKLCKVYLDHITASIEDGWDERCNKVLNEVHDEIEILVPPPAPRDAFEFLMSTPQPPRKKFKIENNGNSNDVSLPCPTECYCNKCRT